METVLKVESLKKYYGNESNLTKALDNISFQVLEAAAQARLLCSTALQLS